MGTAERAGACSNRHLLGLFRELELHLQITAMTSACAVHFTDTPDFLLKVAD
jgi:hypothetical protein